MYAVLIENKIFIHLKLRFQCASCTLVKGKQPKVRMTFQKDYMFFRISSSPFTRRKKRNYLIKLDSAFSRLICTKQRGTGFSSYLQANVSSKGAKESYLQNWVALPLVILHAWSSTPWFHKGGGRVH